MQTMRWRPAARGLWRGGVRGLVACQLGGCSLLFVNGPPAKHERMADFDCTTSRLAPVFDAFEGAAYVAASVGSEVSAGKGIGNAGWIGALGFGASAVYGFSKTSQCARAKQDLAGRKQSGALSACGSDADCKADRICEAGLCVAPPGPRLLPEEP